MAALPDYHFYLLTRTSDHRHLGRPIAGRRLRRCGPKGSARWPVL